MACGVALFSSAWWGGLLTWVAFAVVLTAAVTFLYARRREGGAPPGAGVAELAVRIDDLSRRIEALESRRPEP